MRLAEFNKDVILGIAVKVRLYKKLFVTTEGTMFRNEQDAENAVRVKNMIIDEPSDYVGIKVLTEDMFTTAKLREYGKDESKFASLFDDAVVPRMRKSENDRNRKVEEVEDSAEDIAELQDALGLEEPKAKTRKKKE